MSTESTAAVEVVRSVSVPLSQARTFELFTTRMTDFWPKEHSIGSSEIAEVVVEPRTGGRWFERGVDGSECPWGRVAAWDHPAKSGAALADRRRLAIRSRLRNRGRSDFHRRSRRSHVWSWRTATCSATATQLNRCGDLRRSEGLDRHLVRASPSSLTPKPGARTEASDGCGGTGCGPRCRWPARNAKTSSSSSPDSRRQQWEQPSLCERWRVRDVVAHVLSYDELSRWALVKRFAKGGFLPNRVNAVGVAEYSTDHPNNSPS